jgi:hypothetical protein
VTSRGREPRFDAFFAASRDGDFDRLLEVLDPDVELPINGGVLWAEASLALHGARTAGAGVRHDGLRRGYSGKHQRESDTRR